MIDLDRSFSCDLRGYLLTKIDINTFQFTFLQQVSAHTGGCYLEIRDDGIVLEVDHPLLEELESQLCVVPIFLEYVHCLFKDQIEHVSLHLTPTLCVFQVRLIHVLHANVDRTVLRLQESDQLLKSLKTVFAFQV